MISDNVWKVLVCPNCGSELDRKSSGNICAGCKSVYKYKDSGALDLRLKQPKKFQYEFNLGDSLMPESGFVFNSLAGEGTPEVDFRDVHVPYRLSKKIMSYFPKASSENSLMLDLGCGSAIHREVCETAGFEYVGLDYDSEEAVLLGDAHCLPFKDESFEFVLSISVLEHIRFPFVMMKEINRVLEPGGKFIGKVAFLEPFHGDSFYHHTHLGVYNSLNEGGFEIEYISPSEKWLSLTALVYMGLFPRMPRILSLSLMLPIQILHRVWWKIGEIFSDNASEHERILRNAGSFTFIARRKSS